MMNRLSGLVPEHTKTMHLLPDWLDESIIKIDFIEDFRRELKEQGIEWAGCPQSTQRRRPPVSAHMRYLTTPRRAAHIAGYALPVTPFTEEGPDV